MTEQESERWSGWTTECERRMALEGLYYGIAKTKEQDGRTVQILRDVLAEVKSGKVFNMDEVLEHWQKDDEQRRRDRGGINREL